MKQISKFLRRGDVDRGRLMYWCQGCEDTHEVGVGEGSGPRWGYNGNPDKPTFTPSVLVTTGHYCTPRPGFEGCWCTYAAEHPEETDIPKCQRCHTFITDGMVQFLSDCTHALAGQTLPLPELPPHLQDAP